jgi:hypothetical protein
MRHEQDRQQDRLLVNDLRTASMVLHEQGKPRIATLIDRAAERLDWFLRVGEDKGPWEKVV